MRDHYHGVSHPVLVDLPSEPTINLLDEMDVIADELRTNPEDIEVDDQIKDVVIGEIGGPAISRRDGSIEIAVSI